MAFVFQFSPEAMSARQYDECIARLAAAGAGAPDVAEIHSVIQA